MIQSFNGSPRRILTFPAVHPCRSIAPATLVASLIALCRSVTEYRTKHFGSNARNAQQTIRQIGNLAILLEEIRDSCSFIPDSTVVGFSDIHLTVQKVRYLLEDCSREGARMWMLMKSDLVASRFRDLVRGLEILPVEDLDLSDEAMEVAELVMRQARKARFEVRADDEVVIGDVLVMLNRFESGGVPDRDEMKRVMDYIGVKKWSDCYKEVKFLDSEIEFHFWNPDMKDELELLSRLLGLMNYSRCVFFDSINGKSIQAKSRDELLDCLNSDDFRCPISLELMRDPVTIATGHTYDRCSIVKWFRAGNATCPNTGNKLLSTELVPNVALKQLIQLYCIENGIPVHESSRKNRDITRTTNAGSLVEELAVKAIASFLAGKLVHGDGKGRNKAAYEIRLLSKTSIFYRSCLLEAGVIPSLLELLLSEDGSSQENAIAALLNLSKHSKSKALIVDNGGLKSIVSVLKNGAKVEARQHSAATLFYLASVEEYRKLIGETMDAILSLVEMVKESSYRGQKNALAAIYALLMHTGNHPRVLASGAVPLLLNVASSSDIDELVTDSLAVLAILAEKPEGAKAIIRCGALPQVVQILATTTPSATNEHCVCLLLALCINGGEEDAVAHLVQSPSLMGSLYSQLSEGTSRARKKSSALIRVLHEFHEGSTSASKPTVLPRGRFVHAW